MTLFIQKVTKNTRILLQLQSVRNYSSEVWVELMRWHKSSGWGFGILVFRPHAKPGLKLTTNVLAPGKWTQICESGIKT